MVLTKFRFAAVKCSSLKFDSPFSRVAEEVEVYKPLLMLLVMTALIVFIALPLHGEKVSVSFSDSRDEYLSKGLYETIEEEYYVKPGDLFFISIIGAEPEDMLVPVSVGGKVILHPLVTAVSVGGKSLKEAKKVIVDTLYDYFHDVKIGVELQSISPQRIHILGAVSHPGEYMADSLLTLQGGLEKAGGITPSGSKNVKVVRRGISREYNLNNYRFYGDLTENPVLFNDDIVLVDFAEAYAKVYVVTDSVNYVEHFEVEEEKPLNVLLKALRNKYHYSDYASLTVFRDDEMFDVDRSFGIKDGDVVYVKTEMSHVFVHGNVNRPDKFSFVPGQPPNYYIAKAGGISRDGSTRRILIVKEDGETYRYRGQIIEEGDTLVVPLSTTAILSDYLTPISTALSLFATIFVLTN